MENVTLSCSNMSVPNGFLYVVLPHVLSALLQDKDCVQAWYNKDREVLSYGEPHVNNTGHRLVIDENKENLTLSECIDLHHHLICHRSGLELHHFYKVFNESKSRNPEGLEQQPHTSAITIVAITIGVIVILLVLIAFLCYKKPRWMVRNWERLVRGHRQETYENNRTNNILPEKTVLNPIATEHLTQDGENEEGTPALRDHGQNIPEPPEN